MEINNYNVTGTLIFQNDMHFYISEKVHAASEWEAIRSIERKYNGVLRDVKIKKLD
jgi:hypothetical protein